MALLKVIELLAESDKNWEDAAQNAVQKASKTLKNIRSVYIKDHSATVSGGKITKYRVTVKVTFEVDEAIH